MTTLRAVPTPAEPAGEAYDRVMAATGWGVIRPGEGVTYDDVATRCGITVDALHGVVPELVRDGVLEVEAGLLHVTATTHGDLQELIRFRALIETRLARHAAARGLSDADATELRELVDACSSAAAAGEELDYIRTDLRFHLFLSAVAGDAEAVELVRTLRIRNRIGAMPSPQHLTFMLRNAHEHHLIAEAVIDGRERDVDTILRAHVMQVDDEWLQAEDTPR